MNFSGWIQALVFMACIVALTRPLGAYLYAVFERPIAPLRRALGPLERGAYRLGGVDPKAEQTWSQYAQALLLFSMVSLLVSYALLRLQHALPFNPRGFGPVEPTLAWNTAVSFTTNTNWQAYAGESTMSHLSQMAALAWQNFTSSAAGIGAALAVARGLTRRGHHDEAGPQAAPQTLGNFWVDLVRATLYLLLPGAALLALIFVAAGVPQTLAGGHQVTTLEGLKQLIAVGPVASQEAIKILGVNGGGFFNVNSAHPFENPSALTNLVQLVAIFSIPAALTYTYGRMARDQKQGWALFGAMATLFVVGWLVAWGAESHGNPIVHALGVTQPGGNLEGKEVRFGVPASSLFATVTTSASCGAVNSMHDSFTPIGGLVPMVNIQLGEVIFGGVGAGLYGMLVFVVLTVFIAGLMVGRTPEYLGKKIEAREMKLAMLYVLVFPLAVLGFSAWAAVRPAALSSLANAGPHGLSEILYAFTSGAGNNGSAFAGLNADTPFWNVGLGVAMLAGRFLMMIPVLALAGSMVGKKTVAPGPGTFPTNGGLFVVLLIAVVIVVGALTFFPALTLGPLIEHFLSLAARTF